MELNQILDAYKLPEGAEQALRGMNLQQKDLGNGVSTFMGHDGGTPFLMKIVPVYNREKSKKARYEVYDEIELIEWYNDKSNSPTEQIRFLPEELLKFDREIEYGTDKNGLEKIISQKIGEAIGGKLLEAYKNFKAGRSAPGTTLQRWGVLSDGHVASLNAARVFSVEQFAALPRSKFAGIYPPEVIEAHERAQQYVNGKEGRQQAEKQASEMLALEKKTAEQAKEIAEMKALLAELKAGPKKAVKKVKKKKVSANKETNLIKDIEELASNE